MLFTTLLIGVLYYGLLFVAIKHTTAGNASILALMEVLFSFLLLGALLRAEPLDGRRISGAICMVIGACIILLPNTSNMRWGDALVVLATMFPPIGNLYAQRARSLVSGETIMFVRSAISGLLLLAIATCVEPAPSGDALRASVVFFALNGIALLGLSKILWIEGIHRIPITLAASVGSIKPALTLVIAALVLHESVALSQVAGLLPIIVGLLLLTHHSQAE